MCNKHIEGAELDLAMLLSGLQCIKISDAVDAQNDSLAPSITNGKLPKAERSSPEWQAACWLVLRRE
jgi:hypothetical protein